MDIQRTVFGFGPEIEEKFTPEALTAAADLIQYAQCVCVDLIQEIVPCNSADSPCVSIVFWRRESDAEENPGAGRKLQVDLTLHGWSYAAVYRFVEGQHEQLEACPGLVVYPAEPYRILDHLKWVAGLC